MTSYRQKRQQYWQSDMRKLCVRADEMTFWTRLHISEKSGRGVPKIIETYGKEAFTFRENSIVVTIQLQKIKKVGKKVGDKVGNKVGNILLDIIRNENIIYLDNNIRSDGIVWSWRRL